MKNLYRNGIVLTLASCFLAFNFIGEAAATAQKKNSTKPTSTPTKKKSPAPTKTMAKTAPKPTPKTTPKSVVVTTKTSKALVKTKTMVAKSTVAKSTPAPKDKSSLTTKAADNSKTPAAPKSAKTLTSEQIIVVAADSRIHRSPKLNSAQVSLVKIGKMLPVAKKNAAWYLVQYEDGKSGWIPKATVREYANDRRDAIYEEIADRYSQSQSLDFATAAEVSEFLRTAQVLVKQDALKADLSFKRLRILGAALKAVPVGKGEQFPYKPFLSAREKEVIYSDPSGEWLVRSDLFWELHARYTALPIAEEIAWAAANNSIPGECEGYVNCNLYVLRATDGEYLNFYPNGKYSENALTKITDLLAVIVANVNNKTVFTPPSDISDRAEFNRFLTELRTIISKMPNAGKAKTLQQINLLGEEYK